MDTKEQLEGLDGPAADGSDVAAAFGDEMQSLPAQARVTHVPLLGHRIATTGFLVHEDAYYWLLPPRHVYRMSDDGEREPFDLAMTVIETVTRKACIKAVIHGCVCRASFDCQNYPQDVGCMFLGEAARGVPREDGRMVDVEGALEHARRALDAGLVPTLAWEWDMMLYGGKQNEGLAICFCDYCHCDLRLSAREGTERFRRKFESVPTLIPFVGDACKLCGTCSRDEVCCVSAISQGPESAEIDASVCIRCGRCADVCPEEAISYEIPAHTDVVALLMAELGAVTDLTGPTGERSAS